MAPATFLEPALLVSHAFLEYFECALFETLVQIGGKLQFVVTILRTQRSHQQFPEIVKIRIKKIKNIKI
jgi:hypothetical protein